MTEKNRNSDSQKSLYQKAVTGTRWVFTLRLARRVISLAKNVILARLLSPDDFGLLGIALAALTVITSFSQTGFRAALVQKKGDIEEYLDCAWTFQMLRGLCIVAVVYLLAPLVSDLFREPRSMQIIRCFALVEIFRGFTNIKVIYFQRKMEFHKQFVYEMTGILVDLCIAIPLALSMRNVWALVAGILGNEFALCAVSYFLYRYVPRFDFNVTKARELMAYGKWVTLDHIAMFFRKTINTVYIGRIMGVHSLGLYQIAYTIGNIPGTEISETITQVIFPAYSRMQDDMGRLRGAFLRTVKVVSFVTLAITAYIVVLAGSFTHIFLGEKWVFAVMPMRILALAGGVYTIGMMTMPLYLGLGRPRVNSIVNTASVLILVVSAYPLVTHFGVNGGAAAYLLSSLVAALVLLHMACKSLALSHLELFADIGFPVTMLLLLILAGYSVESFGPQHEVMKLLTLLVLTTVGIGVFAFSAERWMGYGLWPLVRKIAGEAGRGIRNS